MEKRTSRVTIESVRKCKGWEHFSDEECQEVIDNYRTFAKLTFDLMSQAEVDPERFREAFEEMSLSLPDKKEKIS